MNKIKYIFIWLLPFLLLCVCGYNFIYSAWIYLTASDKYQRLAGYTYLIMGIIHLVIFIVTSAIAFAFTVYSLKKGTKNKNRTE